MKKLILFLLITTFCFSQNPTRNASGFFAGSGSMNASAIGQFDSTSKGFLFPRMTTTQRNAIASPATSLVIFNTTTGAYNYWNGTAWTTFGGGGVPTLQQVLDNNHDLVDGNNFQGTDAGVGNEGAYVNGFGIEAASYNSGNNINAWGSQAALENISSNVNALGDGAASVNSGDNVNAFGFRAAAQNSGTDVNAFGDYAASNNTAPHVNAFGFFAGYEFSIANVFKNVNLFGFFASADADNQNVFSKWVSGTTKYFGRLSFNNITADRKWELPNASGTIALTSDISNSIEPLEINSTDKTVWNNGKANESTNTSFGEKALKSNTTGSQSTAYGIQALQENTTGELNSAFGANALQNNTTGTRNTAVGSVALYSNTTGSKNTAVGQIALYSNTTGSNNTVVGQDALRSSTTASNNTAMGHEAMYATTTGADNTAVGKDALENNTTGNENIAIGGSALTFNTTGSGNTAIGRLAGISLTGFNTSPTNSIYIGRNAYALAANQTNQIVIGENTTGAGSNTVTLGNSSITTTRLRGAVQGNSFVKDGGTSSQILMADGSVATAGSGITISSGTISASGGSATWGGITGTLSSQTDLQNALDLKVNKNRIVYQPKVSVTGIIGETNICTFKINGGSYESTDAFKLDFIMLKSVTAVSSTYRVYVGLTSGARTNQILSSAITGANRTGDVSRLYNIDAGNLDTSVIFTANAQSGFSGINALNTPISVNMANDLWITITANPSVTSESHGVLMASVTPLK